MRPQDFMNQIINNMRNRIEIIVVTLREYFERHRSRVLFKVLNETYGTAESGEENEDRQKAKKRYSGTLRKERL